MNGYVNKNDKNNVWVNTNKSSGFPPPAPIRSSTPPPVPLPAPLAPSPHRPNAFRNNTSSSTASTVSLSSSTSQNPPLSSRQCRWSSSASSTSSTTSLTSSHSNSPSTISTDNSIPTPSPNLSSCAMSSTETILLARTGDILVCHCRESAPPPPPLPLSSPPPSIPAADTIGDENRSIIIPEEPHLSNCCGISESHAAKCAKAVTDEVLGSGVWGRHYGLLGGTEMSIYPPSNSYENSNANSNVTFYTEPVANPNEDAVDSGAGEAKTEDAPVRPTGNASVADLFLDEEIPAGLSSFLPLDGMEHPSPTNSLAAPLPSFDHFLDVSNHQSPTTPTATITALPIAQHPPSGFLHGVPQFLHALTQVTITKISANPSGSHALLVSLDGMLFSYGNNAHGQLGLGHTIPVVASPTLVTPLLENGGKTIDAAAGATHSLVVVTTDVRRAGRRGLRRPHNGDAAPSEAGPSMCHHQIYAFGRNDGGKLGLIDRRARGEEGDVSVPRRVAMHATTVAGEETGGIVMIAAGVRHSVALVARTNRRDGNGGAGRGAGGVRSEVYVWGDSHAMGGPGRSGTQQETKRAREVQAVPTLVENVAREGDHPVKIAVGPRCTLILTQRGRMVVFGRGEDGILGLGNNVTHVPRPKEIRLKNNASNVEHIAVGMKHALCVTREGRVYAWGSAANGRLGNGTAKGVLWHPTLLPLSSFESKHEFLPIDKRLHQSTKLHEGLLVHRAWAGRDSSVFVMRNGRVLSCGRGTGRLGQGELGPETDVTKPRNMFGGLRLWDHNKRDDED